VPADAFKPQLSDRSTCVVHLVWAPLGASMLEQFLSAYSSHEAGLAHRLAFILNGFNGSRDPRLAEVKRALDGIEHESLVTPRPVLDLEAYRQAAEGLDADRLCFLNSYSRPLAVGWLSKLADRLDDPSVGLTGASGSWGSIRSYNRFALGLGGAYDGVLPDRRTTIAVLGAVAERHARAEPGDDLPRKVPGVSFVLALADQARGFVGFPAGHVRTNGFMIGRELLRTLKLPTPHRKNDALRLESGRESITAQVERHGLRAQVVDQNGRGYDAADWFASHTFWQGSQENLLIADKQTDDYSEGDPLTRAVLARYAWGERGQADGEVTPPTPSP
jgi:hypothetical protein